MNEDLYIYIYIPTNEFLVLCQRVWHVRVAGGKYWRQSGVKKKPAKKLEKSHQLKKPVVIC